MGYLNKILYNVGLGALGLFGGIYLYSAAVVLSAYNIATDAVAQIALVELISLILILVANVVCDILAKVKMNDELHTYCVLIVNTIMGCMFFIESVMLATSVSIESIVYITSIIQSVVCGFMLVFAITSLILSFCAKRMVKPFTFAYFELLLILSIFGFAGAIMAVLVPSIIAFIALMAHPIILIIAFALASEYSINMGVKVENKIIKRPTVKATEISDVKSDETNKKSIITFEKMKEAKMALDNNIITEEEYNKIKEEYLKGMSSN